MRERVEQIMTVFFLSRDFTSRADRDPQRTVFLILTNVRIKRARKLESKYISCTKLFIEGFSRDFLEETFHLPSRAASPLTRPFRNKKSLNPLRGIKIRTSTPDLGQGINSFIFNFAKVIVRAIYGM
jgi:hypothetical protein